MSLPRVPAPEPRPPSLDLSGAKGRGTVLAAPATSAASLPLLINARGSSRGPQMQAWTAASLPPRTDVMGSECSRSSGRTRGRSPTGAEPCATFS